MARRRRVAFARINRRSAQEELGLRPFSDDMRTLGASREVKARFEATPAQSQQEWIAADLSLDASETFLVGVIGFSTVDPLYQLDDEAFSWTKGHQLGPEAASDRSMVPFAVDLRDDRRWIAFGTAQRIRPQGFAKAFEAALNNAVSALGLFPSVWEVDLVTSTTTILDWLDEHAEVISVRRTIRYPNPVRDLQGVYAEMAELAAKTKKEEFVAPPGQHLRLRDGEQIGALLEGVDSGNTDLLLEARGEGGTRPRFNTRLASDEEWVDDWATDFVQGMENVLGALRAYSARRAGEMPDEDESGQITLLDDDGDAEADV